MAYKLYTDKQETFTCEVEVKNASTKGSISRLVVETKDGVSFIFDGKIESGKCIVPIKKLKGLLEENSNGKIHLEIILEDTFFIPWKSEYIVTEHQTVKVNVNESANPIINKPSVQVLKVLPNVPNLHNGAVELATLCEKFDINKSTMSKRSKDFKQLIKEYFNYNPEYKNSRSQILSQLRFIVK